MNIALSRVLLLAVAVVAGVMAPGAAMGVQGGPDPAPPIGTEFPPAVPVVDGWYGQSVAIHGNRFLVGAPYDDWTVGNTTYYAVGSLWLYTNTGAAWSGTRFLPPFWQDGDDSYSRFGESSDIDGDTFVAGAWLADGNVSRSGTAWVYRYNGSWEPSELKASDGAQLDWFGKSVAVSGDRVVVGAPTSDADDGAGALYVFDFAGGNWNETKLSVTGSAAGDRLGLGNSGVAATSDGAVVVAGVPQGYPYGGSGAGSGRVHVFTEAGGWSQQIVAPSGLSVDDAFGWSVAVDGSRMVVGAPGDDGKGSNSGAVYVFEKSGDTWLQTKKLQASDGQAGDVYGFSVAVSGDRIAVGAIGHGGGSVYWYTGSGDTWHSIDPDSPQFDSSPELGHDVDVDGNRIVAGAPYYNGSGVEDSGTAYLLEFVFCDGHAATLVGSDGADDLVGTPNRDVIAGLGGDDLIDGKGGHDIICAGPGNDEVRGKDGNDRLYGEDGNDKLNGAAGNDVVDGGPGKDTVVYFGASGGVAVDLGAGTGGGADQGADTLKRIEHILGSQYGDVLWGNTGGNRLKGLAGADELHGMAGIDILIGAANNDLIYGGDGNDNLQGKAGFDKLFGGPGDDVIEGNNGNDTLKGDAGNDTILGGPGDDTLDGGPGIDFLNGGADADECTRGEAYESCEMVP
jgi:Ca2+-binding RTX toxin-like protein